MRDVPTAQAGLTAKLRQASPIPLDVELTVAPGEVLALVGPSGSGKSTALKAIAGLYAPSDGRVVCNGSVWLDREAGISVPARERRVGMVFQSYALFPHLTAVENVMEALGDVRPEERHGEARALLQRMHLEGLEDRRPALLSGGQQQRVAVARALARRPDILLLDEPFSSLDALLRAKMRRELLKVQARFQAPVILITHDPEDVAALAQTVVVYDTGRIRQVLPLADADKPRQPLDR